MSDLQPGDAVLVRETIHSVTPDGNYRTYPKDDDVIPLTVIRQLIVAAEAQQRSDEARYTPEFARLAGELYDALDALPAWLRETP